MVEGDGLENRYSRKAIVGSNPTSSAQQGEFINKEKDGIIASWDKIEEERSHSWSIARVC